MELGVQRVLVFPQEAVAREVARELADAGCRLVTVRAGVGAGVAGLWDVSSLAVYPVPDAGPERLAPLLRQDRRTLAALARHRGGALLTYVHSASGGVPACSRSGLVHEDVAAHVAVPDPLPAPWPQPPRAPGWEGLDFGDPETEIREAVAVAERMYGTREAAPQLLDFLLDGVTPQELVEPGEGTREFLAELVRDARQRPTRDAGAVLIVPYLAELARSRSLSPGARVSLLQVLLGFASGLDAVSAGSADWSAMGGGVDVRHAERLRDATVAEIPGLVPRWDRESDAARLVLAVLATFCPARTSTFVAPRLAAVPAPGGTGRADVLALVAALLAEDGKAAEVALRQLATWNIDLAEQLDSPHTPLAQAARAALAACVERDLPAAVRLG